MKTTGKLPVSGQVLTENVKARKKVRCVLLFLLYLTITVEERILFQPSIELLHFLGMTEQFLFDNSVQGGLVYCKSMDF